MYAVIRTGGKQYRVQEGRSVKVDRLAGEPGDSIELGEVLLLGGGSDGVTVGAPVVAGARVMGTIAEQGRAPKIIVFRYKAKTRSRKKTGHRQHFTRVVIDDILAAGQEPKPKQAKAPATPTEEPADAKPKARRKPAAAKATADVVAEAPEPTEAAPAEAPAEKPKRTRKKAE